MLDVDKGSIVVSRDVKFEEHRSWEWGKSLGNIEREFELQFPQVDTDEGSSSQSDQAPFNTSHETNADEGSSSQSDQAPFDTTRSNQTEINTQDYGIPSPIVIEVHDSNPSESAL
ncbi:hypothetical protein E3N88_31566 [Mikania micrantha]|uniref:Uncharacterized protein n=1 Tax=Mikania micrantha TaxID=192012 RepID=A0A5N6MQM5_9ASTR|nr:hypothetical protein E3N88_31566 [Mikania micrantha]